MKNFILSFFRPKKVEKQTKIICKNEMYFEVIGNNWYPIEETDETSDKYDQNIRLSYTALSRLKVIDELDKVALDYTAETWLNRIQLGSEKCIDILIKMGCKSERLFNKIKNT
jgi:hypothetical protein